ncbi:unnamed protein product, partial [Symbiodinium necroappetens]
MRGVASAEDADFDARVAAMKTWMGSERFKHTTRPYKVEEVVKLQGTMPMYFNGAKVSDKLYKMLRDHQAKGTCSHTFGALDTVQVTQMAKYLTSVYVSGWQCSSTASTSNEPGPDVADYPYDTVPNKVDQLFRAQLFHDRKQYEERRRMSPDERSKAPVVEARLRAGRQQVDITWQLPGQQRSGSGMASSKKAARREAARRLLQGLPVGPEAELQMRKQMLQGLRYKLSAEVLQDGLSGEASSKVYRVVWRVPQPQGRPPLELSASAEGTHEEAQKQAWESLYLQAAGRKSLQASVVQATQEQRNRAVQQQLEDAAQQRRDSLQAGMSILSSEAAAELAVRHNAIIQRLRIQALDEVTTHEAGQHCTLQWEWQDPNGEQRRAVSVGLGTTKRQAKGEAIRGMLAQQSVGSALDPVALNAAGSVRSLARGGSAKAAASAADFLASWPPAYWSLCLLDAWQLCLAQRDREGLGKLGEAVRGNLAVQGLAPKLWESLLDAAAHVACGSTAVEALKLLRGASLDASRFASAAHKDYFEHFRMLTALERVGANQAMIDELRAQSGVPCLRMLQQSCVLPYITLVLAEWFEDQVAMLSGMRAGDVVYLRPTLSQGRLPSESSGHLAVIASLGKERGKQRLNLRCGTLGEDVEEELFDVFGLESEVTALRCIQAVWAAADPHVPREERVAQDVRLLPEMTRIVVQSFRAEGRKASKEAAASAPPGCQDEAPLRRIGSIVDTAARLGCDLTEAQLEAVRSALQRRVTLIHGPPGTGKTTAAACVVMAWRWLGDRILCAADSNVAADNLHKSLAKWGIKAYRFAPAEQEESKMTAYERMLFAQDALNSFQVVVTTCAGAGHNLLQGQTFPRVLIDESTQSVEPTTLLPMSVGCEHLVLIGDHRQLPPTVVSDDAKRLGLDKSLFARLAEEDESQPEVDAIAVPVLLNEQRRMHPSIARFPNLYFYRGLVHDKAPGRAPIRGVKWPQSGDFRLWLVDCKGQAGHCEEQQGTSWRNAAEADAVVRFLRHLLDPNQRNQSGPGSVATEEVVVLTPYLQQKELLQGRLRGVPELKEVRVSTVDGFQGAEADLVVFSAVRSNREGRLGFLQDTRRANVALTRARRGLVVFADAETLRQADGSIWAEWLRFVEAEE